VKARFWGGPYDGCTLNVPVLDHVQFPIKVVTALPHVDEREFWCQAKYQLRTKNDVEATYQFLSISAP